jgi:hypothetical protein
MPSGLCADAEYPMNRTAKINKNLFISVFDWFIDYKYAKFILNKILLFNFYQATVIDCNSSKDTAAAFNVTLQGRHIPVR